MPETDVMNEQAAPLAELRNMSISFGGIHALPDLFEAGTPLVAKARA